MNTDRMAVWVVTSLVDSYLKTWDFIAVCETKEFAMKAAERYSPRIIGNSWENYCGSESDRTTPPDGTVYCRGIKIEPHTLTLPYRRTRTLATLPRDLLGMK